MRHTITARKAAMLGLLALFLVSMIGLSRGPGDAVAQEGVGFQARLRFVNAVTSLSTIDISVNGERVVPSLAYGAASEWLDVAPGVVRVTVRQERNLQFDWVLFDTLYPVPTGQFYQLVITDFFVIPTVTDVTPITEGMARIRVVHGSVETPAVDIYLRGQETPALTAIGYTEASGYLEIPAGTYSFDIKPTGSTDVAAAIDNVTLTAGATYDAVAIGKAGSTETGLQIILLETEASNE